MTKPATPRPMPTPDLGYDSYVWPRSMTPAKDALYAKLHDLGWRYDTATATFHTPLVAPLQGFGALEYDPEFSWARIQPPSIHDDAYDPPMRRAEPILTLARSVDGGWEVL